MKPAIYRTIIRTVPGPILNGMPDKKKVMQYMGKDGTFYDIPQPPKLPKPHERR